MLLYAAIPIKLDSTPARRSAVGESIVTSVLNVLFVSSAQLVDVATEAISVIFQVLSFKSRGKRIFLMAPIHHHFELKGWEEPKVVVRLWIIAILLALLSLSTLKLR